PYTCQAGLPNIMTYQFSERPPLPDFFVAVSNSLGCQSASFSATPIYNSLLTTCSIVSTSINSLKWNFGDPLSGNNNISTQQNPVHAFTNLGTYTVQLIVYYCGGATDTLSKLVTIDQACKPL